jgi:signal transduction histidine kinase
MAQATSAQASEPRGHERDGRADWDYKALFRNLPGAYLILATDPDFTIVDASDSYLAATLQRRERIVGRPLFEVFPDNPAERGSDGVSNLRASLQRALARKQPDTMAVQKYDIQTPSGAFEERYWTPINAPLLAEDGRVAAIIHRVQDVTDFVRLSRRSDRAVSLQPSTDTVADVYLRSREAANRQRDERAAVATTAHQRARRFRRSLQAAVFVPAIAVLVLAFLIAWQGARLVGILQLVDHTNVVIAGIRELESGLFEEESALRGFLLYGQDSDLAAFDDTRRRVVETMDSLEALTADNPSQQRRIAELRAVNQTWRDMAAERVALFRAGGDPRVGGDVSRARIAEAHRIGLEMRQEEQQLLDDRSSSAQREIRRTMLGGAVATVALAALLVVFFARVLGRTAGTYEAALSEEAAQAAALKELSVSLEARIKERTSELQDTLQELETFAYSVSHDLRAPLRHVNGFVELLKQQIDGQIDDRSRHYMQRIESQSAHMGSLIDDLLAFSRMGRAPMKRGDVDLDELVREVQAELMEQAAGRNVEWTLHPLGSVYADRALLRVVFVNLISNALKYTRRVEQAKITIGRRVLPGEVEIFVRDNGAGFDARYVGKLFGVFQRLHSSEEFEGTGIGLATVRRIAARHGGRVRAEGAVGTGATFYVSIPLNGVNGGGP